MALGSTNISYEFLLNQNLLDLYRYEDAIDEVIGEFNQRMKE